MTLQMGLRGVRPNLEGFIDKKVFRSLEYRGT